MPRGRPKLDETQKLKNKLARLESEVEKIKLLLAPSAEPSKEA